MCARDGIQYLYATTRRCNNAPCAVSPGALCDKGNPVGVASRRRGGCVTWRDATQCAAPAAWLPSVARCPGLAWLPSVARRPGLARCPGWRDRPALHVGPAGVTGPALHVPGWRDRSALHVGSAGMIGAALHVAPTGLIGPALHVAPAGVIGPALHVAPAGMIGPDGAPPRLLDVLGPGGGLRAYIRNPEGIATAARPLPPKKNFLSP